jgi:hypothetical protein
MRTKYRDAHKFLTVEFQPVNSNSIFTREAQGQRRPQSQVFMERQGHLTDPLLMLFFLHTRYIITKIKEKQ